MSDDHLIYPTPQDYGPVMNTHSRGGAPNPIFWGHFQAHYTIKATGELPRPPLHKWAYRLIKTILGNIGLIDRVKPPLTTKELAKVLGEVLNHQRNQWVNEAVEKFWDDTINAGEVAEQGSTFHGVPIDSPATLQWTADDVKQPPPNR